MARIEHPLVGLSFLVVISFFFSEAARAVGRKSVGRWVLWLVLLGHFVVPLAFQADSDAAIVAVMSGALLVWWSTTKLLAFLSGSGPLIQPDLAKRPGMFWASYFLPVTMRESTESNDDSGSSKALRSADRSRRAKGFLLDFSWKLCVFLLFIAGLSTCVQRADLTPWCGPRTWVGDIGWALLTLLATSALMDAPAGVATALGLDVDDHFRAPLFSLSLSEFWGQRWNLTAVRLLRDGVFQPLRVLGCSAAVAGMCTFGVSAVVHELILWYGSRNVSMSRTYWLSFFLFHGVICTTEQLCWKTFRNTAWAGWICSIPVVVKRVYFFVILTWSVRAMFLPPAYESGLPMLAAHCFLRGPAFLASLFSP
eukprot:gb/GEZN01010896.1/.p1 GENE.gb/GEZN01010896.1/~~gb/GEZN01010896.1/.p1  ORF type:complete len:367 (+),score=45.34 gb/GEZN01010896.1/:31-1131(+)